MHSRLPVLRPASSIISRNSGECEEHVTRGVSKRKRGLETAKARAETGKPDHRQRSLQGHAQRALESGSNPSIAGMTPGGRPCEPAVCVYNFKRF